MKIWGFSKCHFEEFLNSSKLEYTFHDFSLLTSKTSHFNEFPTSEACLLKLSTGFGNKKSKIIEIRPWKLKIFGLSGPKSCILGKVHFGQWRETLDLRTLHQTKKLGRVPTSKQDMNKKSWFDRKFMSNHIQLLSICNFSQILRQNNTVFLLIGIEAVHLTEKLCQIR